MRVCPECGSVLPAGVTESACPKCLLTLGVRRTEASGPDIERFMEEPGDRIGHFRLLEVIGEGAFGTVWMAEQEEPVRRKVALKIIKLGMDTRSVVARFEAERQALAMMDHPNIARVFDGGATDQGRPYFVMELVRGVPVTEFCDLRHLSTRERVELYLNVCEAVQHAHQKGIIHRDLKPSNILVTEQDGRAIPKVIDFGIAKATEQRLTEKTLFTHFNQLMGTPAYMSPEQTGLGGLDIDTRSDVYSLGVLLYELITGQTPFDSRKLLESGLEGVQKTIREVEPPKPSTCLSTLAREELLSIAARRRESPESLNKVVRGELDWITLKALEKDRNRRYQSAAGLGTDLRNYLADEPVSAAPPTVAYQLTKFSRRHRAALTTICAFGLVCLAGVVISAGYALRAKRNLEQVRLNAYASETKLAQLALAENNQLRAVELLDRHRPKKEEDDLRGFEWRYLWQKSRQNDSITFRDGMCNAVAFSPDGLLFASGGAGKLMIREVSSRTVITNLPTPGQNSAAFSPDGNLVASGTIWAGAATTEGTGGVVFIWNTRTWEKLPSLPGAAAPVQFSPDGKFLVTGATNAPGHEGKYLLWRTDTWEAVGSCASTPELPWQLRNGVFFSKDGSVLFTPWLRSIDQKCGLKVWKVPTLEPVEEIFVTDHPLCSAALSPDGENVLIGTWFGELVAWDIKNRRIAGTTKENNSGITSIAVVPGAKFFATTSHDHSVSVWESATRKVLTRFRGHVQSIWSSALSPDGNFVATGSFDGTAKLWSVQKPDSSEMVRHGPLIAGFSGGSSTLVLAPREEDYTWRLINTKDGAHSSFAIPSTPPLVWDYIHRPYDMRADAPIAVLGRTDGSLELWNLEERRRHASWRGSSNAITAASFSPDGLQLATGTRGGQVALWNVRTQGKLLDMDPLRGTRPGVAVSKLVYSPDGKNLLAGFWPGGVGDVFVLDSTSGTEISRISGPGNVTTISFSPDGRLLAGAGMGPNEVFLWDWPSGKLRGSLKGHVTGIVQVLFSPDGKTLATGGYDTVKLWNVATAQEIADLPVKGIFREFFFAPDGRMFAVGYLGYGDPAWFVRLYKAPSIEEMERNEVSLRL